MGSLPTQPSCHCSILLYPKYTYGPFSVKRAVDYEHHSMNSQRRSCPWEEKERDMYHVRCPFLQVDENIIYPFVTYLIYYPTLFEPVWLNNMVHQNPLKTTSWIGTIRSDTAIIRKKKRRALRSKKVLLTRFTSLFAIFHSSSSPLTTDNNHDIFYREERCVHNYSARSR